MIDDIIYTHTYIYILEHWVDDIFGQMFQFGAT